MRVGQEPSTMNGQEFGGPRRNALDRTAPGVLVMPAEKPRNFMLPNIPRNRKLLHDMKLANTAQSGLNGMRSYDFYGYPMSILDVESALNQIVDGWMVARGNGTGYADSGVQRNPDTVVSTLNEYARDYCAGPGGQAACAGIDTNNVITGLDSRYRAWFQSTFPKGWGDAYNYDAATWAAKFPGATQQSTAPSWATNNVQQPAPVVAAPAPAPTPRAPQQPTQASLVQPSQTQAAGQEQATGAVSGSGSSITDSGMNWMYIAAAAAAAFLLIPMIGGRK